MTQPLKGRIVKPDAVLVRELAGESVLLNLDTESYFGLDEVGTRMWAALTGAASIDAAYQSLLAEYEVAPEPLRADLARFIEHLVEIGLIQVVDG